ncbi:hypothetical protein HanIR_Chr07g0313611 [Helianthus annuus]|nr:hypothetical protein HanIR_Chr07g0313611 [Helianthus annuus]
MSEITKWPYERNQGVIRAKSTFETTRAKSLEHNERTSPQKRNPSYNVKSEQKTEISPKRLGV